MSEPIMHGSSDDWNKMNPQFRTRLLSELTRLKAEVERLDNLVRYWSEKYQNENARFLRASERIAAKEGNRV